MSNAQTEVAKDERWEVENGNVYDSAITEHVMVDVNGEKRDHRLGLVALVYERSYPSDTHARLIAAAPEMLAALKQIAEGEGVFSRDPLVHAGNVIAKAKALAQAAIRHAEGGA